MQQRDEPLTVPTIPSDVLHAYQNRPTDGREWARPAWQPPAPWIVVWLHSTPIWFRQPSVTQGLEMLRWVNKHRIRGLAVAKAAAELQERVLSDDADVADIDEAQLDALTDRSTQVGLANYWVQSFIIATCWAHPTHAIEAYQRYRSSDGSNPYPKPPGIIDARLACGADVLSELEAVGLQPGHIIKISRELQRIIHEAHSPDGEEVRAALDFFAAPTATRPA